MLDNILYNFPFLAALFWLIYILFSRHPSHPVIRKSLVLYMSDAVLLYFSYAVILQEGSAFYVAMKPIQIFTLSSIFPLYYVYLRLTTSDTRFRPHYIWIFIPSAILGIVTLVAFLLMTPSELDAALQYGYSAQPQYLTTPVTRMIHYTQLASGVVILIEVVLVTIFSIVAVVKYQRTVEDYYSNSEEKTKGLSLETGLVIVIAILTAIAIFSTGKKHYISSTLILALTSIIGALPVFVIGLQSQNRKFTIHEFEQEVLAADSELAQLSSKKHPARPHTPRDESHKTNDGNPKLSPDPCPETGPETCPDPCPETGPETCPDPCPETGRTDTEDLQTIEINISYIAERIVDVMEAKQLYLKTDLRITDVCELLSTNRTYISQAINTHLGGNFSDFINRYRLEFAKDLLADRKNDNYTIESLAERSGFSTAASMNRAFRKIEGITPHQFRQKSLSHHE